MARGTDGREKKSLGKHQSRCEINNNNNNNNNSNIYLLHLGCHPVAVVILQVYKT
jgi:hypothetical protein